eukprot:gene10126-12419_t
MNQEKDELMEDNEDVSFHCDDEDDDDGGLNYNDEEEEIYISPLSFFQEMVIMLHQEYQQQDNLHFRVWESFNRDRHTIQRVCGRWCEVMKSSCRSLTVTRHNIQPLSFFITQFKQLRELEVLGGGYPEDVAKYVSQVLLSQHPTLTSIDLSMVDLSPDTMEDICTSLKKNNIIKSISFESNELGDQGIKDLCDALRDNHSLTSLDLQCCNSDSGLEFIGDLLKGNKSIQILNWSYNPSDYSSVMSLSEGLRKNSVLHSLSLRSCNIEGWGALSLGDTMKINQTIKYLDVSSNDFSDSGISNLSKNLGEHQSLEYLDVSCNAMTFEGLDYLFQSIHSNQTITYLDISRNSMDQDIPFLSEALSTNRTIKTLKFSDSNLTDIHLESLAVGLKSNRSITYLDIS